MRNLLPIFLFCFITNISQGQVISDNFQGSGTITNWTADDCGLDTSFTNPYQNSINTSTLVLKYTDIGGQYANVRFDTSNNLNLSYNNVFKLKIYVPSSSITGNQNNQISLKLQNNNLAEPWTTQTEIVKPILLNQWQEITFNFATDTYSNFDGSSSNPIYRSDFNRVLLQVNGENNNSLVTAYIDDFLYSYANLPLYNNLVWSDEFNGNGTINSTNWHHQTQLPNGNSWYNGEIQHYTNRIDNSFESNGLLNIVAKKETYTNQGQTKQYTSARLNSKVAFQYGKIEFRAKLPIGVGTWPALWMLGQNVIEPGGYWTSTNGTVGWPACGEIDIMEHWGNNQNFVQSAMHTPSSNGNTVNRGGQTVPTVSTAFHIYTLEWYPQLMIFKVDNVIHYIYNPIVKNANTWPFNAPQYLLLNVAIQNDIFSSFLQSAMQVDYVRVYQETVLNTNLDLEKKTFTLSPNPSNNKVIISSSNEIKEKSIYDLQGKLIETIQNDSKEIKINELSNGIYLLKVTNENGETSTQQLIKN